MTRLLPDGSSVVVAGKTQAISDFLSSAGSDASIVVGAETIALSPGASLFIGSNTVSLNAILGEDGYVISPGPTVLPGANEGENRFIIIGDVTTQLSAIIKNGYVIVWGKTVPVCMILGTQHIPLRTSSAGAQTGSGREGSPSTTAQGGLGGIIASMGGLRGPQSATSISSTEFGGNGTAGTSTGGGGFIGGALKSGSVRMMGIVAIAGVAT